jgi:hypothetical protein
LTNTFCGMYISILLHIWLKIFFCVSMSLGVLKYYNKHTKKDFDWNCIFEAGYCFQNIGFKKERQICSQKIGENRQN